MRRCQGQDCEALLEGTEAHTVEAFELTGLLLCADCAEAAFEEAGEADAADDGDEDAELPF